MKFWQKHILSEQDIIIGCINADLHCQNLFYERYASRMFGVCLRYAPDYHSAEDLLQEGFIKVFQNIISYRREGSFEGWLRKIFVHTAIEAFRRKNTNFSFDEITDNTYYLFDESADSQLEAKELMQMIQSLPKGYREILNLYAIEGYTHKEIADMLGISEGTSKSQLSRARNMLKNKIIKHNIQYYEHEQLRQIG